ncbi:MAG: hypothetical protein HZA92_20285 [Verrucomicrobia bacterium]|nr:hypothetical protein [Verrucomicrobiota bacterium]
MQFPRLLTCFCALALLTPAAPAAAPQQARAVIKLAPIPPVGPSPITPDCRYLFVVDMSSGMQRSADGLHRATHRLVASGLGGRMQEGEVFTLWTYADTVLTREFPLNAWTPDLNIALANRAYEFLAQQKFRGKSNLRPVFAELGQALAISTNLTIILVSDGTDVIVGTPFDRPINITYGKRASEMRSAKMPFITALVTRRGEFTHWAVRGGLEDIGLPFPEKPALPAPLLVQSPAVVTPAPTPPPTPPPAISKPVAPTSPPPVVVASKPPETVVPKPAPAPPPVVPIPIPKAVTNTVAVTPPAPKPAPLPAAPKPLPPAPAVAITKKTEPVPAPAVAPKKPDTNLPVPAPKQEAKAAVPPPPKPVIQAPKPPVPMTQPVVTKPKEDLVLQPIPPALPPALRQPKSFIDASNALAKVELLRPPPGTSAPPAKPLEARVIQPKPVPPRTTNSTVAATKPAPPPATLLPPGKTTTNATNAAPPAASKTIPIIVPPATTQRPATTKPAEKGASSAATQVPANPAPSVVATAAPTRESRKPEAKSQETTAPKMTPNGKPAKPAGQLAVASPGSRNSGWIYLAAAVALLVIAGGIIAHLLRPRPHPSAISQSLDDKRV